MSMQVMMTGELARLIADWRANGATQSDVSNVLMSVASFSMISDLVSRTGLVADKKSDARRGAVRAKRIAKNKKKSKR